MDIYAENILDHYKHPRGKREVPEATAEHEEVNWSCGDALTISIKLDGDKIVEFGWDGHGCAISQASMSLLSEELEGKTPEEIDKLQKDDVYALLGVPIGPRRFKCALLSLHTLKNALRKAKGLPAQDWLETVELQDGK